MTIKKAIEILETHNKWRKGADIEPTQPKLLTEAIDVIIKKLKKK